MLENGGYVTPSQLSRFGWNLQKGIVEKGFRYQRSSLYRTILKRLNTFGFIDIQQVYRKETGKVVQAYVLLKQLIPKRPPLGGKSFWKLAWQISRSWNSMIEHGLSKG
jgi:hypothetical protein